MAESNSAPATITPSTPPLKLSTLAPVKIIPDAAPPRDSGHDGGANAKPGTQIVITLAGDTGFSPHMAPVNPRTSSKAGRTLTFEQAFAPMARDVDGDLNFVNVETVITARNDLRPDPKGQTGPFYFKSHPNGFAHLVKRGVNLFSLANNHSMDFGVNGLRDTLRHAETMRAHGLKAYAGIGNNRFEASEPALLNVKGAVIGFSAIGIVTNNLASHRAGEEKPGQIAYRSDDDFYLVTDRMRDDDADYKILSVHYGIEGQVRADWVQTTQWRQEADDGIDLIVGHHAHVVRGVEMTPKGGLIFYGLGNFMHHGTANITDNPVCLSYGLFARVHVAKGVDGKWHTRAVEAIPVTGTHISPRRYASPAASHARIHALNYLGGTLDNAHVGARGMRFTPQPDGSGLFCVEGADGDSGRIGKLCSGWRPAPPIPNHLRGSIASSCAR